jgi:hypothetical protein
MDEAPRVIDYITMLASMEAQYAALGAAIPTVRVLASLSGGLVPEGGFAPAQHSGPIARGEVLPGAFHGRSIPAGAVLFLQMVREKQKSGEIAAALLRGGYQTNSSDFNNQVHAALDRATKKDGAEIIKMAGAYWGLREWLSPNVRASMASKAVVSTKKTKKTKKRKVQAPARAVERVEWKPNESAETAPKESSQKEPETDSNEGRILSAVRSRPTKEWTAQEIADAASIPRVQTVHFLAGKLAHREMIRKTGSGTFTVQ